MYMKTRRITEQCPIVDTLWAYACKHTKGYRIYIRTQILPPSMEYTGCSACPQLLHPQPEVTLLYFCCFVFQPPSYSQAAYSEPLQKERTGRGKQLPLSLRDTVLKGKAKSKHFEKQFHTERAKAPYWVPKEEFVTTLFTTS